MSGVLTTAFKEQEAVSLNEGMGMQGILQMMASSQGRSDPIIGQEDVLRGNISRGDDPSDRFIDNTTKPPSSITASSFIEEFATLDIEEQEAYAEAMFAAGYGDNLAIEDLDDIYDPYFISQMLTNGITRAKESFKIGRQNLPDYEGALSEFEDVSLEDVLSKLEERKQAETFDQGEPVKLSDGGNLPRQTPRELPRQEISDPKAEGWASENTWFGQDRAMTFTAFEIHKDLVEKEGYDPKSDEYYVEVNKRIRVDFPQKFGNTSNSSRAVQSVASATRSVKPGRKTVRLTSSQVAIAKKLGVPLEEYAKQLKLTKEA